MLMKIFKLTSFYRLVQYFFLYFFSFRYFLVQLVTEWSTDPFFAGRALEEREDNTRSRPLLLDLLDDAINMEYVLTV